MFGKGVVCCVNVFSTEMGYLCMISCVVCVSGIVKLLRC